MEEMYGILRHLMTFVVIWCAVLGVGAQQENQTISLNVEAGESGRQIPSTLFGIFFEGSISISMSLYQTSFCFVCSHLSSGEKEGDEIRRNSDVMEILKKTHFPPIPKFSGEKTPESILEHDRVIWLGDLNYRIALCLEKDQLQIEQRAGHVFKGWNEGRIHFAPTYKYPKNSDCYAGEHLKSRKRRRTPAWCDRILWYGKGLKQISYGRGESKLSDHRPVYSVFTAEVDMLNRINLKKDFTSSGAKFHVEELLPRTQNSFQTPKIYV